MYITLFYVYNTVLRLCSSKEARGKFEVLDVTYYDKKKFRKIADRLLFISMKILLRDPSASSLYHNY